MKNLELGAHVVGRGKTRFRFWAPDCENVSVLLNGADLFPMKLNADGIFEAVMACEAGATYKYKLPDGSLVPDPASRSQDGDVHDSSIVVDSNYNWTQQNWRGRPWHETIIYELHVGLMGGFAGVQSEIPRLAELGVTAIELMPINDFPGQRNWGYDGVLPYAVDSVYGTTSELKGLIDTAHRYGVQVFLDVVYNHFGPEGNYLSHYASSFFDPDCHTPWGNAINFRSPVVRRFFVENALYWLKDFRFDGLRFDAVHAIKDDSFLVEMAKDIRSSIRDRQIHLVLENENNQADLLNTRQDGSKFNAQWCDDWHHCLHVLLTAESEGYYEDFQRPIVQLQRCLTEGFVYQGDPSPHFNGAKRGTVSHHLPPTAFVVCLQNHDQIGNRAMGERLNALAQSEALRAAIVLLLCAPQVPMIFMGEEWCEDKPFLFFTDHHDELAQAVREGRRMEFARFANFADPQKRQMIPDPNDPATFAKSIPSRVEVSHENRTIFENLYKKCLRARRLFIMPFLEDCTSIGSAVLGESALSAAWRLGDRSILTIAANFGASAVHFEGDYGDQIVSSADGARTGHDLPAFTTSVWIKQA